jgi:glycine betaine catabolism B
MPESTTRDAAVLDAFDGATEIRAEVARREASGTDFSDRRGATAATVDGYHPKRLELVVATVLAETATTSTFRLRRADGGALPPFLAGQYVNLFVSVAGVHTSRPFAISSSPEDRSRYDLTVRRVPNGLVSNHLIDTLAVGDRLQSTGPMGTFHYNPLFHGDSVVFLAGGSGVAPAMSMIRDIVDRDLQLRLHLLYGSRRADDIIFRTELDALAARHDRIRVDHVVAEPDAGWAGATGFLSAALIRRLAGPLGDRMVYVCGPQALYPYALAQLAALGHKRRRIRFEANGAPARPQTQPGWPARVSPTDAVTVRVQGGPTFTTTSGTSLLDALERHGVHPEAACRSGECSLCRIRVISGEVFSPEEAHLRKSDRQFGYVHSCVAYALSDVDVQLP